MVGDFLYRKITKTQDLKPAAFAAGYTPGGEEEGGEEEGGEEENNEEENNEIIVIQTDSWLDAVPGGGKTVIGVASIIGIGLAGRKLGWF